MATYFVKNGGSDGLNGLSDGNAWATIAKVNGSTFVAGDTIQFNRGDTWRESLVLTTNINGASGNPVTFQDYGSGSLPIFDGADILTGWANLGGNKYSVTFNPGFTFRQVFRNGARAVKVANTGALVANYQWTYTGTTLTIFSTTDPSVDSSIWLGGARWKGIINNSSSHIVFTNIHVTRTDDNSNSGGAYASFPQSSGQGADVTLNGLLLDYSADNAVLLYDTVASINGFFMNKVTGDHCSARGAGIPTFALGQGSENGGLGISNVSINNCIATNSGIHGDPSVLALGNFGIKFAGVNGAVVNNFTAMSNGDTGLAISSGSSNITVAGGVFNSNGLVAVGDKNGIEVGGFGNGSSNILISGADISFNQGPNIEIASTNSDNPMSNVTITRCRIAGSLVNAFQIGGGHTGQVFSYNLVYGSVGIGIRVNAGTSGNPDLKMYGNLIWGNGTGGGGTADNVDINANGSTFKNNIVGQANGQEFATLAGVTVTSDFNDFYHSGGGSFMTFQGATKTLATWKSSSGQDTNSLSVDPLFVTTGTDFRLLASSPAIGAGVNLGVPYNIGLDNRVLFPWVGGVAGLLDQNLTPTAWGMGAFVFFDPTIGSVYMAGKYNAK